MPVANCYVLQAVLDSQAEEVSGKVTDSVALWAFHAGADATQMTINEIAVRRQFGQRYAVVADLEFPDLWSQAGIEALQLGLSAALADFYAIEMSEILIKSRAIPSAMVVECGKIQRWETP